MISFETTVGAPDARKRDELRRLKRERFAMGLTELNRSDLVFGRFDVTHEPTGHRYRVFRGEIDAAAHPASAFYFLPSREVVLLERVKQ